jgi:hypothetical protein
LLSYQGEKLVINENNNNSFFDQSTFEINLKSYTERRNKIFEQKKLESLHVGSKIRSSSLNQLTKQKTSKTQVKRVGISIRNNVESNVNNAFIRITNSNQNGPINKLASTLKRAGYFESARQHKKSRYVLSDSEEE